MAAEGGFVNVETLEEPAAGDRRAVSVAPRRLPSLGILGRSKSTLAVSAAKVIAEEDSEEDDSVLAEMRPLRTRSGKKNKRRKAMTFLCIDCEVLFCVLFYLALLTIMFGLTYLKLESHTLGNEAV